MILVQMNFAFPKEMMGDALTENAKDLALTINQEKGFISKIWIEDAENEESGGIYLFEDRASAESYVAMHQERMKQMGVTEMSVKYFEVNQFLSELNRANLQPFIQ